MAGDFTLFFNSKLKNPTLKTKFLPELVKLMTYVISEE